MRSTTLFRVSALGFFLLALAPMSSFAALGGDVSSVQADQARMRASIRVAPSAAYTTHEMQSPAGTVVREFVSREGKVFGVAWQGPFMPDLRQVLGSYYDQYEQAARQHRSHGPISLELPGLIFQSGGHQRAFAGRAYVPEMVPQGVHSEEIR